MNPKLRVALCGLALLGAGSAFAVEFTPARSSDDLVNPHKGWML